MHDEGSNPAWKISDLGGAGPMRAVRVRVPPNTLPPDFYKGLFVIL